MIRRLIYFLTIPLAGCISTYSVPPQEGTWMPEELNCKRADEPGKRQFQCLLPSGINLEDLMIEGQQGYFKTTTALIDCKNALEALGYK